MIHIRSLDDSECWVMVANYSFVFPISIGAEPEWSESVFRHPLDHLIQGAEYEGENDVTNFQVIANLSYLPSDSLFTVTPGYAPETSCYLKKYNGTIVKVTQPRGVFHSGDSRVGDSNSSTITHHYVVYVDGVWRLINVTVMKTSPTRIKQWSEYRIWNIRLNSNGSVSCNYTYTYNATWYAFYTTLDWSVLRSMDEALTLYDAVPPSARYTSAGTPPAFYRFRDTADQSLVPVAESLSAYLSDVISDPVKPKWVSMGELAASAIESYVGSNMNFIEFIRDLRHPDDLLPKIRNFLLLSKSWRKVKRLSSEYLRLHYGILPTISDIKTLWSYFDERRPYVDKHDFEVVGAGFSETTTENGRNFTAVQRLKIAIANTEHNLYKTVNALDKFDIIPNVEHIWDLVPYSFVIDWLIPIGDGLKAFNDRLRIERYDIRYVTMSYKVTESRLLTLSNGSPLGLVEVVSYHRWTSDQCPLPPLPSQFSTQGSNHWLEASALILQRLK